MSKSHRFVLGLLTVVGMALRPGPTTADDKPAPRFEITPKVWFVGDPKLDIRVVNLTPNQKVTVVGQLGKQVSRRIEGVADARGQFDLRGDYDPGPKTGAPFRILWDTEEDPSVEPIKERSLIQFRAEIDGKPIATGTLQKDYGTRQEPKVTSVAVNERGLHGEWFAPPGKGPFPGVIVFGGSEGGLGSRFKAAMLARHGFACLALAYFDKKDPQDYPGLPKQLIEIPLEYFEKAIGWMKEQKQVRGDRLAVMGGSRGGELALLLGTMFPDVKAVVAYTPSHLVWGGWPQADEDVKKKTNRPAWTFQGKPVPFMSRILSPEEVKELRGKAPHDRRPEFTQYLKDEAAVRAAAIPVEKTAGPILMITGMDDWLWPASEMADEVMKRLAANNHPFRSQHLSYEGCGHVISLPLGRSVVGVVMDPADKSKTGYGGCLEANSFAAWDSWPKVVKFLHDSLNAQERRPSAPPQPVRRFERSVLLQDSGETAAAASLGDLDGDGDLDIVLSTGRHWASPLRVYFNDGKGKFPVTRKIGERDYKSYGVPLADLDGDGDLDLVAGTDFGDDKPYFLNDGKGRFTLAGHFGDKDMATRNLVLADMNGDGKTDIVVVNRGSKPGRPSFIFLGDGQGRFPERKPIGTGMDSTVSVAVGDLNGDGKPDLVLANRDERQCTALLNNGKAQFGDPLPFGPDKAETRAIALGDLNGDGNLDVVASHLGGGSFIYWGDGKGRFPDKVAFRPESESSYSLAIADLNGDGQLDIVAGNQDQVDAVYFNDGWGKSFRVVRLGEAEREKSKESGKKFFATYGLALGDIDKDGHPDIVVARTGGPSAVYFSESTDAPKPTQIDLDILRKADELLADESKWNRKCERRYRKDDKTWSLYTALHKASLEVTGEFNHRQPALEEVRKTVESQTAGKKYQHRLMDYNNDPETKFADIKKVFTTTIERVALK